MIAKLSRLVMLLLAPLTLLALCMVVNFWWKWQTDVPVAPHATYDVQPDANYNYIVYRAWVQPWSSMGSSATAESVYVDFDESGTSCTLAQPCSFRTATGAK